MLWVLTLTLLFGWTTTTTTTEAITTVTAPQMNPGDYLIANAKPGGDRGIFRGEFFEILSHPISTVYSEVYWTVQKPIPLPQDVIDRFADGRVMALTGYEVDIVRSSPIEKGKYLSVPAYQHYNHHYYVYIKGDTGSVDDKNGQGEERFTQTIPLVQLFSEGNGGEFRKSFHGYPKGFAQLVESPKECVIEAMVINTKNPSGPERCTMDTCPYPTSNNIAPQHARWSPLIECPCTSRIVKKLGGYVTQQTGACKRPVLTPSECFAAAVKLSLTNIVSNSTVSTTRFPGGCYIVFSDGKTEVFFNTVTDSTAQCGAGNTRSTGHQQSLVNLTLNLDASLDLAEITIQGPDSVWFGVGFNASLMADSPYAIIVDGEGAVQERKLAAHDPGYSLTPSVEIISNKVSSGIRTVVLHRKLQGNTREYYTFDPSSRGINFINALGATPHLQHHATRTGATISLIGEDSATCVCNSGTGTLNGLPFPQYCAEFPTSDLLLQKNTACFIETYNGGQQCCPHQTLLLDANQQIPREVDEVFMKYRFYFEEYQPEPIRSHSNMMQLFWMTEAFQGEYDVPQCPEGTPHSQCIHTITSRFTLGDLMTDCNLRLDPMCVDRKPLTEKGLYFITARGHCHAPACIKLELYDERDGTLICRNIPVYGTSEEVFDEDAYIVGIPPCVWSIDDPTLPYPPVVHLDTPFLSIVSVNNSYPHYGMMANWSLRGAYVF